jgi:glycosyltransferase involved in cell wall biosynthesis
MNSHRKKVLFLIPSLAGGGAERVFTTLLAHLDRTRFELHLGVLEGEGTYMKDVPPDVGVHRLNISRVRYAIPGIVRLVWKVRPYAVLSTLGHLNLALLLGRPFMPRGTRLLVREAAVTTAFLKVETRHPRLWTWLYRGLYRRADAVICLSDSMAEDLAQNFRVPREVLVRIYNPVEIERVRRLADHGGNPYIGPGPHFVAAGRLTRQKGFDVLLHALPLVLERFPEARLTVLGDGPLKEELRNLARRLGILEKVDFLGFQENPWRYLKHADLVLLPSRYEGTSNILLEALAIGTPVIASDCPGGTREIQGYNPEMILVPPENPSALTQAIVTAFNTSRRPQEIQQVQEGLRPFDLQQVVSAYSRVLEQV